jgi:PAS domain S-box-containing protein
VPLRSEGRAIGTLSVSRSQADRPYTAADERFLQELADRAALAIERARVYEAERRAHERTAFLSEASAILAADLDYAARLRALSRLVVPSLADWCVVDLLGDDGRLHRLAAVHADPALQPTADKLLRRYPTLALDAAHTINKVLASGSAWLDPAVAEARFVAEARDPEHLTLMRRLGFASEMVVPLVARGRALGTLTLAFGERSRRHTAEDLALAQELAGRAALALDAARLYTAERAARARYRGLFEGTADALIVTAADWRVVEVNEAAVALTGYAAEELHGMAAFDLFADRAWAEAELARLASERIWRGEFDLRRKDGSDVPIEAQMTVVDLPDGTIYVSAMRDIGERRGLERLQQEFLALVTHDLKNPLVGIRGHAQLLQRRQAYAERSVGAIVSETRRLERLIDDLLDVTRAQTGQLTLRRDWGDVLATVQAAIDAVREVSVAHSVEFAAPEGPIIAFFDRDRVEEVIQNLLLNAVKYSPDGGSVQVRVEERGAEIWLTVADEGIGVSPDALPRLFERFYRTAEARELHLPGLGLGLYVTRSLVEEHGGRIWAESAGPGRGSSFTVVLPRDPEQRATPASAASPPGGNPASL